MTVSLFHQITKLKSEVMQNTSAIKQAIIRQEVKDLMNAASRIKTNADAARVSARIMDIQDANGPTEGLAEIARKVNEWHESDMQNAII